MRLYLVLCLAASAALAQTPTTPCDGRSVLNAGTGQPGWMLMSGPGITVAKPPVVVPKPIAGWSPLAGASWVSINNTGGNQAGSYTYQYVFCVCSPQGASLTLSYFADNGATVQLNGKQLPGASVAGPKGFTGTASGVSNYSGPLLVTGTNTLTIVVNNVDAETGLEALLKVIGGSAGPCPPPCPGITSVTGQSGWTLASGPGVTTPRAPAVVSSPNVGWSASIPGAKWVSASSGGGSLAGDYVYTLPLCSCQGAKPSLTLSFFADNAATAYLNSTIIVPLTPGNKTLRGLRTALRPTQGLVGQREQTHLKSSCTTTGA
jgi:hypothetical protein